MIMVGTVDVMRDAIGGLGRWNDILRNMIDVKMLLDQFPPSPESQQLGDCSEPNYQFNSVDSGQHLLDIVYIMLLLELLEFLRK